MTTATEERRPGLPLDQHLSLLVTSDDRAAALGLAIMDARDAKRDAPQESYIFREAYRRGLAAILAEFTPAEQTKIMEDGRAWLANMPKRAPRSRAKQQTASGRK